MLQGVFYMAIDEIAGWFSVGGVQTFNGIGRIDNRTDRGRELEYRYNCVPATNTVLCFRCHYLYLLIIDISQCIQFRAAHNRTIRKIDYCCF